MPNIFNTAQKFGLVYTNAVGPWPCEQCGQVTQFAEMKGDKNHVFCRNEYCRFERLIDLKNRVVIEADGSQWRYDTNTGQKTRVTRR